MPFPYRLVISILWLFPNRIRPVLIVFTPYGLTVRSTVYGLTVWPHSPMVWSMVYGLLVWSMVNGKVIFYGQWSMVNGLNGLNGKVIFPVSSTIYKRKAPYPSCLSLLTLSFTARPQIVASLLPSIYNSSFRPPLPIHMGWGLLFLNGFPAAWGEIGSKPPIKIIPP